jgi:hypothetical protein
VGRVELDTCGGEAHAEVSAGRNGGDAYAVQADRAAGQQFGLGRADAEPVERGVRREAVAIDLELGGVVPARPDGDVVRVSTARRAREKSERGGQVIDEVRVQDRRQSGTLGQSALTGDSAADPVGGAEELHVIIGELTEEVQ